MHFINLYNRMQLQIANTLPSIICRNISVSSIFKNREMSDRKMEWKCSVKEAEKVVGYPTSFLNLRWLLTDEIANVAMYIRKLVGTEHPLLKIAKNCLFKNDTPGWGLIVLLLSKAGGLNKSKEFPEIERDLTAGILHSQRVLAEVTEMMRTAILIHNGILHIEPDEENNSDLNYGNKIGLLSGDYLLSKSFSDLASLRNQEVNFLISSALRDLSESQYLTPTDQENRHIPTKPNTLADTGLSSEDNLDFGPYKVDEILGNCKDEWVLRNLLGGANLLGKSCQASMLLSGHDEYLQEKGYLFGKHIALSWQALIDLDEFYSKETFNLVGAPILLHLSKDASLYEEIEKGLANIDNCDYKKIKSAVLSGNAIQESKDLQREYARRSLNNLKEFDGSLSARDALTKIISCM